MLPLFVGSAGSPFARIPGAAKPAVILVFALVVSRHQATLALSSGSGALNWNYLLSGSAFTFLLGLALALGISAAFTAIGALMRTLDMQIGFGAASIFDPHMRTQESLLGTGLILLVTYLFFELDVDADLLHALSTAANAEQAIGLISSHSVGVVIAQFGVQFTLALLVVLPTMVALLMVDLVSGMLSKTMPQMNVYFVALPLKIGVGLIVLGMSLQQSGQLLRAMMEQLQTHWTVLLEPTL